MKKDQEILLSLEELQQLLQGKMIWSDVSARLGPAPGRHTVNRNLGEPLRAADKAEVRAGAGAKGTYRMVAAPGIHVESTANSAEIWEGKPVMALLSGVGLLTVLSWGYFALLR